MIRTERITIPAGGTSLGACWGYCLTYDSGSGGAFPLIVVEVSRDEQQPGLARSGVFYQANEELRDVRVTPANGVAVTVLVDRALGPRDFINLAGDLAPYYLAQLIASADNTHPFADTTYRIITRPGWARKLAITAYCSDLNAWTAGPVVSLKHGNDPAITGLLTDLVLTAGVTLSAPFVARSQNIATFGIQSAGAAETPGDTVHAPGSAWHDPMPPPDVILLAITAGTPAAGQKCDVLARWGR